MKRPSIKEQYIYARGLLKEMVNDEKFKCKKLDEFYFLIDTNEKHNHQILDDLNWMKKTALDYKHKAQKSEIAKEDLRLSEFKIREL